MGNTWKTTTKDIVQVDQSTFDFPHNTTWDSPQKMPNQHEPYSPLPVTLDMVQNPKNNDQNSPGGFPGRFCQPPKSEWFSDEGAIVPALENMWKYRKAAIESVTASIEEVNSIKVLVNPSPQEVLGFLKKFKSLRALVDPETGDIFAWNGYQSEHNAMIRYYGLDISWEDDDGTYIRHVTTPADVEQLFMIQQEVRNKLAHRRKRLGKQASSNILEIDLGSSNLPVFVNPSRNQVVALIRKYPEGLRVIDGLNGDYVWEAGKATHDLVLSYLSENGYEEYSNVQTGYIMDASEVDDFNWLPDTSRKQAGNQSASVPDYLCDEWKTEQIMNNTDEEPYVNHDQRDYPYGMHDSPENTGNNIGWPKDEQRSVVHLDTLENPAYRLDPFGIGSYNVIWYNSLPASDGIEKMNPE